MVWYENGTPVTAFRRLDPTEPYRVDAAVFRVSSGSFGAVHRRSLLTVSETGPLDLIDAMQIERLKHLSDGFAVWQASSDFGLLGSTNPLPPQEWKNLERASQSHTRGIREVYEDLFQRCHPARLW